MKRNGNLTITASNADDFLELVEVTGDLDIFRGSAELPLLTSVGGDLSIRYDSDVKLPVLTSVGGGLYVDSDVKLPVLTSVGGDLIIFADVTMPVLVSAHGAKGKLICESAFGLWLSDEGYYYAGCRTKLTKEEALAHWNREDKRALKFTAAILEQK